MDQHLVDHVLEEQRRGKAEQVERQCDQQDLADQPAVLDDLRHEPGDVEPPGLPQHVLARGDEDQLARPHRLELFAGQFADRQSFGAGFGHRELDQRLVALNPADDEPAAGAIGERGHRRAFQFVPARADLARADAGFLAVLLGQPQQVVGVDRAVVAEAVTQLRRIDRDAVHRDQRGERNQPAFVGRIDDRAFDRLCHAVAHGRLNS